MSRLSTKQRRSARRRRAKYARTFNWRMLIEIMNKYRTFLAGFGRARLHPDGRVTP